VTAALRLGMLGCSDIALRRALPAFRAASDVVVASVASRSAAKARRVATGLAARSATYDELVADPEVDAIYISVPNALHSHWTMRALEAGKHVLCEKPLATAAAEAEQLAKVAKQHDLVLRENFTFLHHSQHDRVREVIASGLVGEVRTLSAAFCIPPLPATNIRYDSSLGGGALLDVGVYPLRVAQLLLGQGLTVAGATLRIDERLGVDLAGHALLVAESGAFATMEFGFQHSYRSHYAIAGSAGYLSLDRAFAPPAHWQPTLRVERQDHTEQRVLAPADQYLGAVTEFVQAARGRRTADGERDWLDASITTARLTETIRDTAIRTPMRGNERTQCVRRGVADAAVRSHAGDP
jgi:NDP-hexose-3-ketoreductase